MNLLLNLLLHKGDLWRRSLENKLFGEPLQTGRTLRTVQRKIYYSKEAREERNRHIAQKGAVGWPGEIPGG